MKEKTMSKLEKEKLQNESDKLLHRISKLEEEDRAREQKEMGIGVSNIKIAKSKKGKEKWPEPSDNPWENVQLPGFNLRPDVSC